MLIVKPLIALIATSALAATLFRHLSHGQRRPSRDERSQHREDVHRWEGEGGNLPARPQR
ncbi:hypothetical protein ACG04R_17050 [Roseateles sp. BYS78W]|uniref:Uncharacterized protein n=1 Tax=Pelomonas candidula TaxID=3299025 RepID=A0ABW7HEP8_9BURK